MFLKIRINIIAFQKITTGSHFAPYRDNNFSKLKLIKSQYFNKSFSTFFASSKRSYFISNVYKVVKAILQNEGFLREKGKNLKVAIPSKYLLSSTTDDVMYDFRKTDSIFNRISACINQQE